MENTYHSVTVRTWLARRDMPRSIPTLGTSSLGETTWRQSVTCFCISSKDRFHGKVFQGATSRKSMPTLKRKSGRSQSKTFARTNPKNLKSSCIIAVASASLRTPITDTSSGFLKMQWKKMGRTQNRLNLFGIRIDWPWKRNRSKHKWWKLSKNEDKSNI